MGSCQSTEKNGILLVVFRNLQLLFCLHFFACTQCRIVVFWLSFLEVRTENLKFRTDLQNQVIDGWSVTHRWLFTKANSSIPCMLLNGILKSWLSPRETLQSHVQVGLSHLRARKQGISQTYGHPSMWKEKYPQNSIQIASYPSRENIYPITALKVFSVSQKN